MMLVLGRLQECRDHGLVALRLAGLGLVRACTSGSAGVLGLCAACREWSAGWSLGVLHGSHLNALITALVAFTTQGFLLVSALVSPIWVLPPCLSLILWHTNQGIQELFLETGTNVFWPIQLRMLVEQLAHRSLHRLLIITPSEANLNDGGRLHGAHTWAASHQQLGGNLALTAMPGNTCTWPLAVCYVYHPDSSDLSFRGIQ
mmetsp:Transcript_28824/g.77637  ORF Transcript_28824/g.77637 Transcript_28824/m.77637 type:complete len:203 (-) Transcript_28824:41-649(-)